MDNKKRTGRRLWMSVLCLAVSIMILTVTADAETKGKVCAGVKWSYDASSETLTISGKGYAKIKSFQKYGTYTWPASEEGALPVFKKIVFKEGITKIDFAYFTMEGIESIALPKSLKTIVYGNNWNPYNVNGKYEPYSTTLTKITVNKKSKNFSSSNGVLYSKNKKTLYVYPSGKKVGKYVISKKVTKIARNAFYGSDIHTVKLSANLTSIGERAFRQSTITTLQINKKLKTIGDGAFMNTDLTDVKLPESLKTIGRQAFYGCAMTKVVLPKNIKKIDLYAFSKLEKLTNIVVYSNCDLDGVFTLCSVHYADTPHCDEYFDKEYRDISVTLGKNMTAPVTGFIEDLGTKIKFTVGAGNTRYYVKDGSLYLIHGNKLKYTPQKSEPATAPTPAAPSPSPEK